MAKIFWENWTNTMAVGAPAPSIIRSSTAMLLYMYNKRALVFHNKGFQLPAPSQCQEMVENAKKNSDV